MNAIDEVQKQIDALQAQVDLLKQQSAEVGNKWEPDGGDWWIDSGDVLETFVGYSFTRTFGLERATKEQAQRAAVEMRKFNRLLALRDELCGDDAVEWKVSKGKWKLYFDHNVGEWSIDTNNYLEYLTPYFSTELVAQRACDMLNSGEVEL